MARPMWSSSFLSPTVTATTEASGYPSSRLLQILPHPVIRRWRATSTILHNLVFDFGSTKTVVAIALFGANFPTYTLAHSADNISFTSLSGETAVAQDTMDGYYKAFYLVNGGGNFSNRYVRLRVASGLTTVDGASYYTLGCVLFMSAINNWPRDIPSPVEIELNRSYVQSGNDIAPAGPFYLTRELNTVLAPSEISQLQTIGLLGEHQPFLFTNNWSVTDTNYKNQVYLYRYRGGMRYSRYGQHYLANPSFIQVV